MCFCITDKWRTHNFSITICMHMASHGWPYWELLRNKLVACHVKEIRNHGKDSPKGFFGSKERTKKYLHWLLASKASTISKIWGAERAARVHSKCTWQKMEPACWAVTYTNLVCPVALSTTWSWIPLSWTCRPLGGNGPIPNIASVHKHHILWEVR
jgi:hypothetical protein